MSSTYPLRIRQSGFSLIEVLVSLIILAIGMLGTAGLMMSTLRSNQTAGQSAIAARLAADFQEILFMNTDSANDTGNASNLFTNIDTTSSYSTTNPASCLGAGTSCAPAGFYSYMVDKWILRVANELPGGVVKVCRDSNPLDSNGLYKWACTAGSGASNALTVKIGWAVKLDKGENTFLQSGASVSAIQPRFVITLYGTTQDAYGCASSVAVC